MKWTLPNVLTLIRILLVPVFVLCYFLPVPAWNVWAAVIFVAAAVTDWADGFLARRWNQVSTFGKLWDPAADKLLVTAALLMLMQWGKCDFVVVLILIGRELLIGAVRQVAASRGVIMAADKSGKLKAVVQYVAVVIMLLEDWPFTFTTFNVGLCLLWFSAGLAVYSCAEYMVKNKAVFDGD